LSYRGLDGIIKLKHVLNKKRLEIWKENYQTAITFCHGIELQIPYLSFKSLVNNLCVKVNVGNKLFNSYNKNK
jgi:hypothetical protein